MNTMSPVKRICICAVCIAICYVLPMAFHTIPNAGSIFAPMHIPVLLCGLICGWPFGLICGAAGPVLSSVLTGMPPAPALVTMIPELMTYGFVSGLLFKLIRTKQAPVDIYLSLLPAIICGRIVGGIAKILFWLSDGLPVSMAELVSGYVLISWPATLIQVVFIPMLVMLLMKSRLIPQRYPLQKAV